MCNEGEVNTPSPSFQVPPGQRKNKQNKKLFRDQKEGAKYKRSGRGKRERCDI